MVDAVAEHIHVKTINPIMKKTVSSSDGLGLPPENARKINKFTNYAWAGLHDVQYFALRVTPLQLWEGNAQTDSEQFFAHTVVDEQNRAVHTCTTTKPTKTQVPHLICARAVLTRHTRAHHDEEIDSSLRHDGMPMGFLAARCAFLFRRSASQPPPHQQSTWVS